MGSNAYHPRARHATPYRSSQAAWHHVHILDKNCLEQSHRREVDSQAWRTTPGGGECLTTVHRGGARRQALCRTCFWFYGCADPCLGLLSRILDPMEWPGSCQVERGYPRGSRVRLQYPFSSLPYAAVLRRRPMEDGAPHDQSVVGLGEESSFHHVGGTSISARDHGGDDSSSGRSSNGGTNNSSREASR